ncbi:trypsin-like peptidase domain-containing protein [Streptomyces sp. NPDC001262]|uniref:S1C family serine protease n=1 Tax=Streptomyces sp. NPDC001262 TaxID=3364552 RepID=UPI0036B6F312
MDQAESAAPRTTKGALEAAYPRPTIPSQPTAAPGEQPPPRTAGAPAQPDAAPGQGAAHLEAVVPSQPTAVPYGPVAALTADAHPEPATSASGTPGPESSPITDAPSGGPAYAPDPHGMPASGTPGPWRYDPWAVVPGQRSAAGSSARRRRIVGGAVLVALVAGAVGGGVGAWLQRDGFGRTLNLPQTAAGDRPADRAPGSVSWIAARALPGVVTLHVSGSGESGTGTGFVLDKQGHILTNNHVVQPAGQNGSITVTFNGGQTARATVVGRDSGYDLAVVKVSGVSGLTPLPLGNSDSVRVGDSVVAIGAPFDLPGTVTTGIISAKERPITAGGKQEGTDISYVDALQTDAAINPGNSGGPLMDSAGRVVGINSAIRSAGGTSGEPGQSGGAQGGSIGLGFAIPVNQARRVAEELINTGRATHAVIGVTLDMAYTGDGARVNTKGADGPPVTPGGPGDKAGIRTGDVIRAVDGVRVHNGQELIVKVRSHRPGDRLRLTVERDGRAHTAALTLGSAGSG